jgi:hypothetical protein
MAKYEKHFSIHEEWGTTQISIFQTPPDIGYNNETLTNRPSYWQDRRIQELYLFCEARCDDNIAQEKFDKNEATSTLLRRKHSAGRRRPVLACLTLTSKINDNSLRNVSELRNDNSTPPI